MLLRVGKVFRAISGSLEYRLLELAVLVAAVVQPPISGLEFVCALSSISALHRQQGTAGAVRAVSRSRLLVIFIHIGVALQAPAFLLRGFLAFRVVAPIGMMRSEIEPATLTVWATLESALRSSGLVARVCGVLVRSRFAFGVIPPIGVMRSEIKAATLTVHRGGVFKYGFALCVNVEKSGHGLGGFISVAGAWRAAVPAPCSRRMPSKHR